MLNAPRFIRLLHVFLALFALLVCILYVVSGTTARGQKTSIPFHISDSGTDIHLDRIIPPACLSLLYLFTCISYPIKAHNSIYTHFRTAQVNFKTSKYIRPIIVVVLALHVAWTSFVIIEELAIYNFLGKVATTVLPKAVCAQPDALCGVYKAGAWAGAVLAVLVIVEVVTTSKNIEALERYEQKGQVGAV
ncbi:hypothetical protein BGZ99_002231 [Dissophora globulifera]|uniref:Uncharacterized protein n=1 Tax=Dissophora globulifera TaxID=979702 RepID=A0A9P6RPU5_9FUNG|nr:hypothetical protein BGZ99_002231 [Dissophora globulifera]